MRQLILTLLTVLLIAPAVYAQDTMVPVLVDFVVNTPVVDTSSGDATVSLTIRVQDDLSGVVQVLPNLFPPTGSIRSVACSLVSGDVLDGIYDCTAMIPQHAPTGTWEVRLGLEDSAGNAQILSAGEIAALGFPSTFEVTHDSDDDGITDDKDDCPNSDLRPTVIIEECDSGVDNTLFEDDEDFGNGCTIADLIIEIAAEATHHDQFVSGVADLLNGLKGKGVVSGRDKSAIQRCTAKSNLP